MAGRTSAVIRPRRTSGVRPTAAAIEGSAAAYRLQSAVMLCASLEAIARWTTSARQPVAQRLDDRACLHEAVADRRDDLLRARAVAVDADRLDLHVDDLARDGPDLAVHHNAHGLVRGLGRIADERVLAELPGDELPVVGVHAVGEAFGGDARFGLARLGVVLR